MSNQEEQKSVQAMLEFLGNKKPVKQDLNTKGVACDGFDFQPVNQGDRQKSIEILKQMGL